MPQRNPSSRRFLTRVALFSFAGWALVALGRGDGAEQAEEAEWTPVTPPQAERKKFRLAETHEWADWDVEPAPKPKRRLATTLVFVTLFFAGASLSAIAGDETAQMGDAADSTATTQTDAQAADGSGADAQSADAGADASAADGGATSDSAAAAPATGDSASADPASGDPASSDQPVSDDASAADAPAADPAAGGDASADSGSTAPSSDGPESPAGGSTSPAGGGDSQQSAGSSGGSTGGSSHSSGGGHAGSSGDSSAPPVLAVKDSPAPRAPDPEASEPGMMATVWLHRTMPDPTPPAKRLAPAFARMLRAEAKRADLHWAVLLGVLRAQGHGGRWPAARADVRGLAKRLVAAGGRKHEWMAALGLSGRTTFADRAVALTRYDRAAGLHALVVGLEAAKPQLQKKVLNDKRLEIYPGGRDDVARGRVNVRVLVLMEYLANAHGEVTVSCLISGHRLFARPGVVSAHIFGLAVDIAALGNTPILGHQNPGGLTEQAVREILLLPAEMQPQQVISLLGLGGPSFPLPNHYDHIHVGY